MARKTLSIAVLVLGISAFSSAKALYRIEVLGGAPVIAQDQPVTRGSVVVFHRHPDGRLTGVPRELVGAIEPAGASGSATPRASGSGTNIHVSHARLRGLVRDDTALVSGDTYRSARPLEPGEMLVIGPTGSGPSIGSAGQVAVPGSSAEKAAAAKAAVEAQVFPGDLTTPVSPSNGGSTNMAGTASGTGNGQPVLNPTITGAANVANNGATPVLPTGAQSGSSPINPNGFPAMTTGAQSGANPIGPNGFPTTATGPQPGGAQPVNPNGFPATNQPAQTNSTPKK